MSTDADKKARPVFGEVAASHRRDDLDSLMGDLRAVADPLLRDLGAYVEVYRDLMRDHQVKSCWQQRRRAVVHAEWDVEAGGDGPADQAAAEFLKQQLQAVSFDRVCGKMLSGLFYGYAVGECLWGRDGSRIVLTDIRVRKPERFRFGADGSLRLISRATPQGEVMPPAKFWVFTADGDDDDDAHGVGLGSDLYWPVFLKRNAARFWAIALEKFGMPTATGTYPEGTEDGEKRKLLEALYALHGEAAVAFPEGFEYQLVEATRRAGGDHQAFLHYWDLAIAKIILSQTMTTEDGSSRSQAEVHAGVRDEVVQGDADLLCESFNTTVARWLTTWNFPGAKTPRVWRQVDDAEDLDARAVREEIIARTAGLRPTAEHVRQVYGGDWEVAPVLAMPGPAFAEAAPSPAALIAERMEAEGQGTIGQWLESIEAMVRQARSLSELREMLLAAYPHLDGQRLSRAIGDGLLTAELAGRYDVEEGA